MQLTARVRDGEPQEGEAPYTTETTVIIIFLDNNQKPTFDCKSMAFDFREELIDQTQKLLCTASYEVDDDGLPVHYFLDPKTSDDIADTFQVDSHTGLISLKNKISYKEHEQLKFRIVASNDSSPTSNNPNSFLDVTCNVSINYIITIRSLKL